MGDLEGVIDDARIVVRPVSAEPGRVIATLGPAGTSSEMAGKDLAARLGDDVVTLHPSYEDACAAVLAGRASRLLVANAYHGVSEFYMDQRLALEQAFVFDTPLYGLACRRDEPLPLSCGVVTHPAPKALIRQLLPPGYRVSTVAMTQSTSAAAAKVANGSADLALTTRPAANRHGLQLISPARPIRMLWSVFVRMPESERVVPRRVNERERSTG